MPEHGTKPIRGARAPDFFLVGVPRSGTSSLYDALRQHPQIFAPLKKENCFTCPELDPGTARTDTRWFTDRDEYLSLFAPARPDQIIGEACVYNIYSPHAPRRILELNERAVVIVQVRDPVEQMYSNWALKWIMRDTRYDRFEDAIAAERREREARSAEPSNMREYLIQDKAAISSGLSRFLSAFGRDRVLVSFYDEFARDPLAVVRETYRQLGVDAGFIPRIEVSVFNRVARWDGLNRAMGSARVISAAKTAVPKRFHPAFRKLAGFGFRVNRRRAERPPLDPTFLADLRDELRSEVERLGELVGRDLVSQWWPAAPTVATQSLAEPPGTARVP